MKVQRLGEIEIHKITEMPRLPTGVRDLFPTVTDEMIAVGRSWLPELFLHPVEDVLYLAFHSFVIRTPRRTILVDTCCGNDKQRPSMPAWHELNTPYLANLAAAGLAPDDIDVVICTHLHADHVGWNTRLLDGRWVPTFPNATYVFGRTDYDHWQALHDAAPDSPVNRGAHEDSVLPVVAAGQAMMVDDRFAVEMDLGDGVWLEPSAGHSPGHVSVNVRSGDRHALMTGDAIHHPLQLRFPELGIFADFDGPQAAETRKRIFESLAGTPTTLLTAHFVEPTACTVLRDGAAFDFRFSE